MPFGGRYRIIDFVLSNFVNSGFYRIKILTQYKSDSLNRHITRGWSLAPQLNHFIDVVPAQQRVGPQWYLGSADAIYQSLHLIHDEGPRDVCVFGGDNIYKMQVGQMMDCHRERGADLTVATIPVPIEEGSRFGIIEVDADNRIVGFEEKPENPRPIPGQPDRCLVSMGNYIFTRETLIEEVRRDAELEESAHDFGKSIVTHMVNRATHRAVYAYDYSTNVVPGQPDDEQGYWRDVGTIESYWRSSMDLVSVVPSFDLYNRHWPIRTYQGYQPPAKFVHDDPTGGRVGMAINSLVAEGCIVSGGVIRNSVLFPQVRIHSYATVEESVLFDRVQIGRRARIRRCILDKNVDVPPDTVIGYDPAADRARFDVSEEGIVVIPKEYRFD